MRIFVGVVPFEFSTAKKVEMKVEHFLSSVLTVICNQSVTRLVYTHLGSDFLCESRQACHGFRGDVLKTVDMQFWNDQNMNRGFRVEVMKGKKVFIFMYGIVRDLFVYDFAEDTHRCSFSNDFVC